MFEPKKYEEKPFVFEEEEPKFDDNIKTMIVIYGLPIVDQAKLPKLKQFVTIQIGRDNLATHDKALNIPADEKGITKGFGFFDMKSEEAAKAAVAKFQNLKLGNVFLTARHLEDVIMSKDYPDEYTEPKFPEYVDPENTGKWITGKDVVEGGDVFLIHSGTTRRTFIQDPWTFNETLLSATENKDIQSVCWSPKGSYLAVVISTSLDKGRLFNTYVQIFSGEKLELKGRTTYMSQEAATALPVRIAFSPQEKYMVIWTSTKKMISVVDLTSQGNVFKNLVSVPFFGKSEDKCPIFWSHDDKKFAVLDKGNVEVFDCSTLRHQKIPGLTGVGAISTSPTNGYIACFVPSVNGGMGHISVYSLKTLESVRRQNIFNPYPFEFVWHPTGRFLVAHSLCPPEAAYKKFTMNIFVFRICEKGIPVQSIDNTPCEVVHSLAWEPTYNSSRFAFVSASFKSRNVSERPTLKSDTSIVICHARPDKILRERVVKTESTNAVSWSPRGQFFIAITAGVTGSTSTFIDSKTGEITNKQESIGRITVEWDCSGRFATIVRSDLRKNAETGYTITDFYGKLIRTTNVPKLHEFFWRPRPRNLLTDNELKMISDKLPEYRREYEKEAKDRRSAVHNTELNENQKKVQDFNRYMEALIATYVKETDARVALLGFDPTSEDRFEITTETTEKVIETKQTKN